MQLDATRLDDCSISKDSGRSHHYTSRWNTSIASKLGPNVAANRDVTWTVSPSDELTQALWEHFGNVLLEANAVPPSTGGFAEVPEAGSAKHASAMSQLFTLLHRATAGGAFADAEAAVGMTDSDRVRLAALTGAKFCSLHAGYSWDPIAILYQYYVILINNMNNSQNMSVHITYIEFCSVCGMLDTNQCTPSRPQLLLLFE